MKYLFNIALVVFISITFYLIRPAEERVQQDSLGSGTAWALNSEGYMVTAYHVVKGTYKLAVMHNNRLVYAFVVATDTRNDIAIVKINSNTKGIPLQLAYVDGEPSSLYGFPVPEKMGEYIHKFNGHVYTTTDHEYDFRGLSCPGNSGGPLVGTRGVVGLASVGFSPFIQYGCSKHGAGPKAFFVAQLAQSYSIPYTTQGYAQVNGNSVMIIYGWSKE